MILSWAIHRIGGGCLMLQPTSSAEEIAGHLDRIPPFAMFVSQDLLPLGQAALGLRSLSLERALYRFPVPGHPAQAAAIDPDQDVPKIPTLDDLLAASEGLPPILKAPLSANEANRRVAYYCTTSGTSGFQVTTAQSPSFISLCSSGTDL